MITSTKRSVNIRPIIKVCDIGSEVYGDIKNHTIIGFFLLLIKNAETNFFIFKMM